MRDVTSSRLWQPKMMPLKKYIFYTSYPSVEEVRLFSAHLQCCRAIYAAMAYWASLDVDVCAEG